MREPFYIIPRIGGLAYLNNPKAACSSVLLALSRMRLDRGFAPPDELLPDGSHPIHGFHPAYAHMEYFFCRWPLSFPALPASFIRFSFVRNPYDRFYSFYKSKVVRGQSPIQFYEKFGLRKGCSFEECVEIVTSLAPEELEHHSIPQTMLLCEDGRLLADFIGKVEELDRDWQVIAALTGFDVRLERVNVTGIPAEPVYSAETQERIYTYYRNDFKLFGYEKDSTPLIGAVPGSSGRPLFEEQDLDAGIIAGLQGELAASNERIRQLAGEFEQDAGRREEYFRKQGEFFRELLLKTIFFNEENLQAVNEAKALELSQALSGLRSGGKMMESRIDSLRKQLVSCKDRTIESKKQLNRLQKSQQSLTQKQAEQVAKQVELNKKQTELNRKQEELNKKQAELNRKQEELEKTRIVLYQHILATFRSARKNPLKKIGRFCRSPLINEVKLLVRAGLVDAGYYFEHYPHVISAGMTAAEHYVRCGAQMGYNPSPRFNTRQYLADNPDVAYEGVNPLVHFALRR